MDWASLRLDKGQDEILCAHRRYCLERFYRNLFLNKKISYNKFFKKVRISNFWRALVGRLKDNFSAMEND